MRNLRTRTQDKESKILSAFAAHSADYLGAREAHEEPCEVRTCFQRDCHRIVHSKAFRRLRGKTQVFLWPEGDHYRTRLTHCMEVSQIARTLARALDLNEDLAEAISLGHDLGHTPFGHAGEDTMQKLVSSGFRHERQSLRVVQNLENGGKGLNLTAPVRDGILNHSKGAGPLLNVPKEYLPKTLEGQIVRLSDLIAYINHDMDDAMRAKVLTSSELPPFVDKVLGQSHSGRLTRMIKDVVEHSQVDDQNGREPKIAISEEAAEALEAVRGFLYERVYYNKDVHAEFKRASSLIERLWDHFTSDMDRFYDKYWPAALKDGAPEDDVRDFVAGMTDAYAVNLHDKIFTPRRWYVL